MSLEDIVDTLDIDVNEASGKMLNLYERMTKRENTKNDVLDVSGTIKRADFFSFIPVGTRVLGLDISKNSTGWCLVDNGIKTTGNIHLSGYLKNKYPQHMEVIYRYELKEKLNEEFGGQTFDYIFIEDVFQGANAKTVRLLYEINTAIDELIIEGKIMCRDFRRISNQTWKGWLYKIDSLNETKAMTDKLRIQKCLAMLGVYEEGDGFQDRLDATGIVVGYFMDKVSLRSGKVQQKKLVWSDVAIRYRADKEDALNARGGVVKISDGPINIGLNVVNRSDIERLLLQNPEGFYITANPVPLGFLATTKKISPIKDGGYLAFWIKPDKRRKYMVGGG